MKKTGILGGTFDPFHNGHLSIAKEALEEFNLSKILLIPAKVQPFKLGKEMADEKARVDMTRLAAEEDSRFIVSTIETDGENISYTYKTLCELQKTYPDDKFYFIMGADSFLSLNRWYMGKELLRKFAFIIARRPGYELNTANITNAEIEFLHNDVLQVSSTEIKEKIRRGKGISDLVPLSIERYINEHRLYK